MAYLAQFTREDLADALTRLAAFATEGKLALDATSYPHMTQDIEAAQCLLRALKTEVDRLRLPCVVRFHQDAMELETVYESR